MSAQHSMDDMMKQQFNAHLWTQFVVIMLGLWLIAAPPVLGYLNESGLTVSDILSGMGLMLFGTLSLSYERGWARWATTSIGLWLLFSPLVFSSASAAAYANDSLVGMLAIGFAIIVPGMPGMRMMTGPTVPPGWSYNPSSWQQRAPIIGLAFVSFLAARYLAAFQLEHIPSIWDPFFRNGTARVLTSDVSRAFPISDAGLGATAYAIELMSTFMGGTDRWRTMPWMVVMFGILVIPLGVVSIILVVLQPVMVDEWCTICLFTALTMLIMIPFAVDEVVAMAQFMADVRRRGDSLWRNFWLGGTMEGGEEQDKRTPAWPSDIKALAASSWWGITLPRTLVGVSLLGLGLMAAPAVLGMDRDVASYFWIIGPLITTFAVISTSEVLRTVRLINIPLGLAVAVAPFQAGVGGADAAAGAIIGAIVIALSLPRGRVQERYAVWSKRIL